MFDGLTGKLETVFRQLRGRGVLTEAEIQEGLRGIRMALLEADVHFQVVKDLVEEVRSRALGQEVSRSLLPGQQVVKIVHEALCRILGGQTAKIALAPVPPTLIMLAGLQGSGKTTTAGKLAYHFKGKGKRVLLVPADVRRPAAIEQLQTLGGQIGVPVYATREGDDPVAACRQAVEQARRTGSEVVVLDTAGRLQIDEPLMEELRRIRAAIAPHETLLVADAMTGQEAVRIAQAFHAALDLDGVVLTKLDGDARGGAALSMAAVVGRPIKLVGVGEKAEALEPFHPERMASRILGMGDVLTLIEKAEAAVSREEATRLAGKIRGDGLTLEDFRDQLRQMKKLGSIESLLGMIPGLQSLAGRMKGGTPPQVDDREVGRIEAIINSMTAEERRNHTVLNGRRRLRIARGSGTSVQEVNRVIKQFVEAKTLMKRLAGNPRRAGRLLH
jgi:signal recognition particle subunit SRP54